MHQVQYGATLRQSECPCSVFLQCSQHLLGTILQRLIPLAQQRKVLHTAVQFLCVRTLEGSQHVLHRANVAHHLVVTMSVNLTHELRQMDEQIGRQLLNAAEYELQLLA